MRLPSSVLALVASFVLPACSGLPTGSSPLPLTGGAPAMVAARAMLHPKLPSEFHLFVPLQYDGSTLTLASFPSCRGIGVGSAPPYTAHATGMLALKGNVVLVPACLRHHRVHRPFPLYIVAVTLSQLNAVPSKRVAAITATPIAAGAVLTDNPWSFSPLVPGLATTSGGRYAFFVAVAVRAHDTPR